MERVVFNALVNITVTSLADICALSIYLSSSSEKPIHPVDWGAAGFFTIFFTFTVTA